MDKIDDFKELLRRKYNYYDKSEPEQRILDQIIDKEINIDEGKFDSVDEIRRGHRR